MSEKGINKRLNDRLMKALKAVNSVGGNSLTDEDLNRQRKGMELAGRLAAPSEGIEVSEVNIAGLACEFVRPELAHNPGYVILYAHGGGYTCGGLSYARILAAKLAISTGFSTVSFAYRLAPENSFPAPVDDGMLVWEELRDRGYDAGRILLAGDSAGGNLVLCLAERLVGERGEIPAAIMLFSPWTDMTISADTYERYEEKDPILTRQYVTTVRDAYLKGQVRTADPKCSPLFGDFTDFPPTLIQVGRNEILLHDSTALYERMLEAGVPAVLDIEEDGWHVYQQMPLPMAGRAMKRLSRVISDMIYNRSKGGELR